ncbi:putative methyltransferase-domain-containing protein [Favolaschia claudopus]|uniref:Methyltransferase-domain-containing protein n=1 Tax=Favolaschia claudopus TaxID=2862362 RepID=A0AAW0BG14_9AGAR
MSQSTTDPEDILSSALEGLYDYQPITLSSAGSTFIYETPQPGLSRITLRTPDTHANNWSLHATSIWAASRFLADNLHYLDIPTHLNRNPHTKLLELGAGAGLPSIAIAKQYPALSVVVSDYPDEALIRTLAENVAHNTVPNCRAVAYDWGSDPSELLLPDGEKMDLIIAADTLWNSEFHVKHIEAIQLTLKKSPLSRVHLIAGLHTGRFTIQSFLKAVSMAGFELLTAIERESHGTQQRSWSVDRAEGEDESERRRWIIYLCLRWKEPVVNITSP